MARIAGDKNARPAPIGLGLGDVVEAVRDPLTDLVHRPPRDFFDVERVRLKQALCRRDEPVARDLPIADALVIAEFVHLDVHAKQISALTRDEERVALVCREDRRLEADVGEIRDREDVHHAPGLIREVAVQRAPDRLPDRAARAVATHRIPCADRLDLAHVARIGALDASDDRMRRRRSRALVRAGRIHDQADELA